jgi:hypothetical protein
MKEQTNFCAVTCRSIYIRRLAAYCVIIFTFMLSVGNHVCLVISVKPLKISTGNL